MLEDWGEAVLVGVAKIDQLIKKEPLPSTQLLKIGDLVADSKELCTPLL